MKVRVSEAHEEEVRKVEEAVERVRRDKGLREVIRDYRDGSSMPST